MNTKAKNKKGMVYNKPFATLKHHLYKLLLVTSFFCVVATYSFLLLLLLFLSKLYYFFSTLLSFGSSEFTLYYYPFRFILPQVRRLKDALLLFNCIHNIGTHTNTNLRIRIHTHTHINIPM